MDAQNKTPSLYSPYIYKFVTLLPHDFQRRKIIAAAFFRRILSAFITIYHNYNAL